MAAQNLELRARLNGTFNDSDSLIYVKTHIDQVDGLLDTNDKFALSLFPSAILETKKLAGTMIDVSGTNFTLADALAKIAAHHNNQTALYPGSYLVAKGQITVWPSANHIVEYGDDGLPVSTGTTLENGDMLYYIKNNATVYSFTEASTGIDSLLDALELRPDRGSLTFATEEELTNANVSAANVPAIVTGYRWKRSTQSAYDALSAANQGQRNIAGGAPTAEVMNTITVPMAQLYNDHNSKLIVAVDGGAGFDYWELEEVVPGGFNGNYGTSSGYAVYYSVENLAQNVWGVINNTYNAASYDAQGLMSAGHFKKLSEIENGANKYVHSTHNVTVPSFLALSDEINVLGTLTINSEGHVTGVTNQFLQKATHQKIGIVKLTGIAENTDWKTAQPYDRATSPDVVKRMIDYFGGLKVYGTIDTSDTFASAEHADGSLALFVSP